MGKNSGCYQVICINSPVSATSYNINQPNGYNPDQLSYDGNAKTDQHSGNGIIKNFRGGDEENNIKKREQPIAVVKKQISKFYHYQAVVILQQSFRRSYTI